MPPIKLAATGADSLSISGSTRLVLSRLVSARLVSSRLVSHVALRRIMSGLVLSFECQKLHMTAGVRLCYCGRKSIWLIALGLNEIQRVTIELELIKLWLEMGSNS